MELVVQASGAKVRSLNRVAWVYLLSRNSATPCFDLGWRLHEGTHGNEHIYDSIDSFDRRRRKRRRKKIRTTRQSPFGNNRVSASPPAPSADLASPLADWLAIKRGRSTSGPSRRYREACILPVMNNQLVLRPDDTKHRISADTAKWANITAAWSTYRSRTRWTCRQKWTRHLFTALFKLRRNPNVHTSHHCHAVKALMLRPARMASTHQSVYRIPPICTLIAWTKRRRWRVLVFLPALAVVTKIY